MRMRFDNRIYFTTFFFSFGFFAGISKVYVC
jgi:hypothetical protein